MTAAVPHMCACEGQSERKQMRERKCVCGRESVCLVYEFNVYESVMCVCASVLDS